MSVLVSNALRSACLLCRCSGCRDFVKVLITHCCVVSGVVQCSQPAPAISNTTSHAEFMAHVGPLPVWKPSKEGFSISSNLTTHSEKTGVAHATVQDILVIAKNDGGRSYWPKPLLSDAAVVPDAPPPVFVPEVRSAVAPLSEMEVFFGPWTSTFSKPIKAEWPTPPRPKPEQ